MFTHTEASHDVCLISRACFCALNFSVSGCDHFVDTVLGSTGPITEENFVNQFSHVPSSKGVFIYTS